MMDRAVRDWLDDLVNAASVTTLCERIQRAGGAAGTSICRVSVTGSRGSSTNLLAGAIARRTQRPVLLVVAHLDDADDAIDDLELFDGTGGTPLNPRRFGALEVLPGESSVSLELLAERLAVVASLGRQRAGTEPESKLIVAPVQALMQAVPAPNALSDFTMTLEAGQEVPPGRLLDWLDTAGYQRVDAIEQPGDFATRGGIIDIFPPAGSAHESTGDIGDEATSVGPIRLDYFGDEIESIALIDVDTMGSGKRLQRVQIIGARIERIQSDDRTTNLIDLLPDNAIIVLHEMLELAEQARGYFERLTNPRGIYAPNTVFAKVTQRPHVIVNQYSDTGKHDADTLELPVAPLPTFDNDAGKAVEELAALAQQPDTRVIVPCQKQGERDRLQELIQQHAPDAADRIALELAFLHRGFVWKSPKNGKASRTSRRSQDTLILVPHHELFHRYETRRRVRRITSQGQASDAFFDLDVGDYVVHVDHGIALFAGLKTMRRGGVTQEYLTLEFAKNALLHVPVSQIDLVQKYVGGFQGRPPLSSLGGKRWAKQKEAVAEAVKDLAAELLRVQAARAAMPGIRYPEDTAWQREFEASFPYDETEDQLAAIAAIKRDMAHTKPMDRLICGDVGFGKTEIAVRAAFKAAEYGKQVAVLVPTTVLAEQHERTFRSRMADYPFRIESISRFKSASEQQNALKELAAGRIDIIIGTHRLLSKDVKFADLGLVIIDEEQRFGVEHKNKLLQFRMTADVLTLTATPIPRTLHMSMLGLRDISSLSTPPLDRRAIVTEVIPYNKDRIRQALLRELSRDGQVFFVHNRVHDIQSVADDIRRLAPDARVIIGHGQMAPRELEQVMLKFIRREADVLVSTTIIESGIDIPTANTMFIDQADHFGLAELHQLRGRVGRYKHRAYCYLLLPEDRPINDVAAKRLKAIEQYAMLGAGFKIAMRDLEIRGAGNLLGPEQSGNIAAVGYEMYCHLLERETRKLRNESIIEPGRTHLELPVSGQLPRNYITSAKYRMDAYRRISRATTLAQLEQVSRDLTDAYGPLPAAAATLMQLAELRIAASTHEIDSIKLEGPDLIFRTRHVKRLDPLLRDAPGRASIIDENTVYYRPPANYLDPPSTLLAVLRKLLVRPLQSDAAA